MKQASRSPVELRSMFGANLRSLASDYPSISDVARRLQINRTQFNRYLAGESFPRPDILARICEFFDVDARVLLEPVQDIIDPGKTPIAEFLEDFIAPALTDISEELFPTGFYSFTRRSFLVQDHFIRGIILVRRAGHHLILRGFEAKSAMQAQGLSASPREREFRGFVMRADDGLSSLVTRRGGRTASFNYFHRVTSFENNLWVGYVTRTVREDPSSHRMTRTVFEYVGRETSKVLKAARNCGFCEASDLPSYHRQLLRPDEAFR